MNSCAFVISAVRYCNPGMFECKDSTEDDPDCIYTSRKCDLKDDCRDGSDEDEALCALPCSPYQFQCASGQCIPRSYECDEDNDCGDASDEHPLNEKCRKLFACLFIQLFIYLFI